MQIGLHIKLNSLEASRTHLIFPYIIGALFSTSTIFSLFQLRSHFFIFLMSPFLYQRHLSALFFDDELVCTQPPPPLSPSLCPLFTFFSRLVFILPPFPIGPILSPSLLSSIFDRPSARYRFADSLYRKSQFQSPISAEEKERNLPHIFSRGFAC